MDFAASLHTDSLADQIAKVLEDSIIEGVLAPGDRIVETELAQQFSTSRAPIREAIRTLAHTGLVVIKPRKGAFVVKPDYDLLSQALDVREVLEGLVSRWAATRLTSAELEDIRVGLESVQNLIRQGDGTGYPTGAFDFHAYLLEHAGGYQVPKMLKSVRSLIMLARKRSGAVARRASEALDEHWAIYEALRDRDGERAEVLMRQHLRNGRINLFKTLNLDDSSKR